MGATRPGSPYHGRPISSTSVHTKVEEELHEYAGIDYDKVNSLFFFFFNEIFHLTFLKIRLQSNETLLLLFFMKKL